MHRIALFLLTLVGLAASGLARPGPDRIGTYLTWLGDPSSSIVVNWVNLYADGAPEIEFRERGSDAWIRASGTHHQANPSTLQVRRVELTGLKPDTAYEFRFEFGEGIVPEHFRTLPAAHTRPIRFAAGGDMMHERGMIDAMNARIGKLDPDFTVMLGDLAYADGLKANRWIDWFQSCYALLRGTDGRLLPMVVAIGNHEVRGGNDKPRSEAPYFYSFFALPDDNPYYALDFGNYLSLILLDSNHTTPSDGPQRAWLASALEARAKVPFLFTGYHYPAWGTTKRPSNGGLPSEHRRALALRRDWVPLFEQHLISAAFEADHHNYKRTHLIRENTRDDARGILYLGDGAWGVRTREVPAPGEAWYLAHAEPRRHVFIVTLRPDGTGTAEAVDAEGTVFDSTAIPSRSR